MGAHILEISMKKTNSHFIKILEPLTINVNIIVYSLEIKYLYLLTW